MPRCAPPVATRCSHALNPVATREASVAARGETRRARARTRRSAPSTAARGPAAGGISSARARRLFRQVAFARCRSAVLALLRFGRRAAPPVASRRGWRLAPVEARCSRLAIGCRSRCRRRPLPVHGAAAAVRLGTTAAPAAAPSVYGSTPVASSSASASRDQRQIDGAPVSAYANSSVASPMTLMMRGTPRLRAWIRSVTSRGNSSGAPIAARRSR